ncbi:uncharacterized protein PGTG_13101 [Puccinia graminis f. sp. tritici CRL 75-36-700-3]|uniref:Hydrophobin n=1 Tax=Puccinia graminis f. sp. tritici (strain CRL 75-36-700-3 / race SCCL) TaxID=418459 RepID=E3KQZ4_PUCGT|nr:uncharacterized protein PGTG_13101 [Puccinia graminis f. sp. tritici CRL 75-36-700-3]EFP86719.1 hypothetical protein PGTG_13101 [Puccinia graminis f. sp. tritici CRL 75-36-700-3]
MRFTLAIALSVALLNSVSAETVSPRGLDGLLGGLPLDGLAGGSSGNGGQVDCIKQNALLNVNALTSVHCTNNNGGGSGPAESLSRRGLDGLLGGLPINGLLGGGSGGDGGKLDCVSQNGLLLSANVLAKADCTNNAGGGGQQMGCGQSGGGYSSDSTTADCASY